MREMNGLEHYLCPNCSRFHEAQKRQGNQIIKVQATVTCQRCGCPMDIKEAFAFSNIEASKGHDAAIASVGSRLRGEGMEAPPEDSMVRGALESKGDG